MLLVHGLPVVSFKVIIFHRHLFPSPPYFFYWSSLAVCFEMGINLTACGIEFTSGNYPNYTYNGTVRGIWKNLEPKPPLITVQGCKKLCGEGSQYYPWVDVSSTITTWVRFPSQPT